MELPVIDVGRLVAGKYELVRLIGKGAMGEVWLATHNSLGGEFAIKLVKPSDDEEDETAAGRFQLEAQVSAKLSRKTRHIVSVSDHGEEDGLAYLVMELLDGESLESRIKRGGRLELAECVAIVMQIARALGQAHAEQIFHRDLKPANVFLTKDEDGRMLVKLLDFGIARTGKPFRTRSPFMTGKDMVLGTPSYMSPEQARGLESLDHRCDLWALSVVAYEALTQQIPWAGDTVEDIFLAICTHRMVPIRDRRADLPPAIDALFMRSFAPKLDERFRSAADLSEAFEVLSEPELVEAAMGPAVRAPASHRNLPAARARQPSTPGEMAISGGPSAGELGSDPVGVAVGGATMFTKKKRSSGWLVALIAALLTIGIVVLALTAFSSRGSASPKPPPEPTTPPSASNDRASIPPPVEPPPTTTTTASAAPTTTTKPPKPTPLHPTSVAVQPPPPVTTQAPPPPPPVVTHVAPPPPPPSATARKTDKGEVF